MPPTYGARNKPTINAMTSNKIELPHGFSREDLMSAIAKITAPPQNNNNENDHNNLVFNKSSTI